MARKKKLDPEAVMAAISGAGSELDLSELAGELLREFGGAAALARDFVQQYHSDRATPTAKSRMMETVMRILTAAAPKNDPLAENLGQLRADQLQTMLGRLLQKGQANGD